MMKLRRRPWVTLQYDAYTPADYSERGVETGAKLEEQIIGNQDLQQIHWHTLHLSPGEFRVWLKEHAEGFREPDPALEYVPEQGE